MFSVADTRYKHEVLVDNDPILFEILDICPKVGTIHKHFVKRINPQIFSYTKSIE